ncbi:tRNA-splicing endonuclease subunit sen54 N-term-domain-containing protein [Fomitopsis serialis]|uniref:tRNA-splicing endonuclease subunit sen54 N-term-domain-containing protein n=1 Tax=Fomitopsis serialis TaxID=139415 RepID=UPI0020087E60|nr:tRNA-splicing endonuclease subunit sen54 N-term-domain-containing protein [Neoantrodia serialis]KAH9936421.1 tRNA-splicing endonuclease subunit sen54 N-term-domain-containing protein [Neoantrodia serialis]
MDDTLEQPNSVPVTEQIDREEDEQSSGDEDQGPDWTKLPSLPTARPFIPKRGEKDFEPTTAGGSGLQRHVLDRSRHAMLEALSAPRTISSKSISYAVWHPDIARAHVTVSRGIHFASMGHSVARTGTVDDGAKKIHKRLELLPEEILYLVERGAMLCWKACDLAPADIPGLETVDGVPMTVQQAFAEVIGTEDLTLEKYQVFAYLKRLGYAVTRTIPPNADYPVPPPPEQPQRTSRTSFFDRVLFIMRWPLRALMHLLAPRFDWWRPIRLSCLHGNSFRSLRFLPGGHDVPLHVKAPPRAPVSPYQIFYNVCKPSTPFKKTAPPPPDYSVVVVNARRTPMPTLSELTALFDVLPELPPPLPRKRQPFAQQKSVGAGPAPPPASAPKTMPSPSMMQRLFPWAFSSPAPAETTRKVNPFLSLKTGKKMVVIAAVDAGMISFFRFGEGVFTEWPMT